MKETITPPSKSPAKRKGVRSVTNKHMLSEQLLAMNCAPTHTPGSERNMASVSQCLITGRRGGQGQVGALFSWEDYLALFGMFEKVYLQVMILGRCLSKLKGKTTSQV